MKRPLKEVQELHKPLNEAQNLHKPLKEVQRFIGSRKMKRKVMQVPNFEFMS